MMITTRGSTSSQNVYITVCTYDKMHFMPSARKRLINSVNTGGMWINFLMLILIYYAVIGTLIKHRKCPYSKPVSNLIILAGTVYAAYNEAELFISHFKTVLCF